MGPAQAGRDEQQAAVARGRTAVAQLVDRDVGGGRVERHRRGHRGQRIGQALVPEEVRLVPGVGRELVSKPGPGLREERLVAVLQKLPQPCPDPGRVGQQPLTEAQLLRTARGGQLQGSPAHLRVGQRVRTVRAVRLRARELQRRVHELLVRQLVQQVQFLGERGARQGPPPRHAGEGHEQVRERRPPQEVGFAHPVGQMRVEPGGHARHPALEARVVPRLGQRVQRHAELGQGGGHDSDLLRPQPRDVDVHAHAFMVHSATDNAPSIDGRRQSKRRRPRRGRRVGAPGQPRSLRTSITPSR